MKFVKMLMILIVMVSLVGCADEPELDEKVVYIKDVGIFEIRHRIFNTYLLHRIDTRSLEKAVEQIKKTKEEDVL